MTGAKVVDLVITDLGVFAIDKHGYRGTALVEHRPGRNANSTTSVRSRCWSRWCSLRKPAILNSAAVALLTPASVAFAPDITLDEIAAKTAATYRVALD